MPKSNILFNHTLWSCVVFVIASAVLSTSCGGESYKEKQAKLEIERKERIQKKTEHDNNQIVMLAEKMRASYFPPHGITALSYTSEFQNYFTAHSKTNIIFRGYIEDVEKDKQSIIAIFTCPIRGKYHSDTRFVRFRLIVPAHLEGKLSQINQTNRRDFFDDEYNFSRDPDYYVSANIADLKNEKETKVSGNIHSDSGSTKVSSVLVRVATGVMMDMIPYSASNETNR